MHIFPVVFAVLAGKFAFNSNQFLLQETRRNNLLQHFRFYHDILQDPNRREKRLSFDTVAY